MKKISNILLIIAIAFSINAQEKHDPTIIQANRVKAIECYILESENSIDSTLITKEYFNNKGFSAKIEIYDSQGINNEYIYVYKDDTLRTERITKLRNEITSVTKMYYDDKLRETKAIDYNKKGKKTGTYSVTKYNDREKTKETKIYFGNKLTVHYKDTIDDTNTKRKAWTEINGLWIQESDKDFIEAEIINADDVKLTMKRRTKQCTTNQTILGLNGALELTAGDILIDESYQNPNGLTKYEKQYLNGKLLGVKKYKYVYMEENDLK